MLIPVPAILTCAGQDNLLGSHLVRVSPHLPQILFVLSFANDSRLSFHAVGLITRLDIIWILVVIWVSPALDIVYVEVPGVLDV